MSIEKLLIVCGTLIISVLISVIGVCAASSSAHSTEEMKACVTSGGAWKVSERNVTKMECVR